MDGRVGQRGCGMDGERGGSMDGGAAMAGTVHNPTQIDTHPDIVSFTHII
jgi:hypothetical protein